MSTTSRDWLPWAALVAVETVCQAAAKRSGEASGALALSWRTWEAALAAPWIWIALICYVAGFAIWMRILSRSSLSRAFPTSAIVFVATMSTAVFGFHESLAGSQVLGAALIVCGIVLLGSDAEGPRTEIHRTPGETP